MSEALEKKFSSRRRSPTYLKTSIPCVQDWMVFSMFCPSEQQHQLRPTFSSRRSPWGCSCPAVITSTKVHSSAKRTNHPTIVAGAKGLPCEAERYSRFENASIEHCHSILRSMHQPFRILPPAAQYDTRSCGIYKGQANSTTMSLSKTKRWRADV
jgi:hypothetical protein